MSSSPIVHSLDALAQWRALLGEEVAALGDELSRQDLMDDADASLLGTLRERLQADRLVLAFVAEFSRGKSELINAIFFSDTGRRVLPATPGRTTMCPVELRWHADVPPRLSLLPIDTRLRGWSLAELRQRDDAWQHVPLDPADPDSLVTSLAAVTRTQRVDVVQAQALGFWHPDQPQDNPPQAEDGTVEVPAWRHAVIHYPHPLLQRGLVVIDTPGLNAVGAEPELTLGLLPTAHAVVFVLGADTGVTKSDLTMWRDHLGQPSLERFVAMNKIDTLADPLLSTGQVEAQIDQQRQQAARLLGVSPARVFPLSARAALAARVEGHADALQASRLPALEEALAASLLPRRQELLTQSVALVVEQLRAGAARRLADRQRQFAEQLLELRGLRGKNGAKLRLLVDRVDAEMADFERSTGKLAALRAVHARMHKDVMAPLGSEALRSEVAAMQAALGTRWLGLGARPAFAGLMQRLHAALERGAAQADEMRQMLQSSFDQLNAEFGFAFVLGPVPKLSAYLQELQLIEDSYGRYLGLGQSWRLASAAFAEQFRRMLLSKLRVVFENAAGELELWSKSAQSQVDLQLRERRRSYARRRESLQRVQAATGELEQRIAEVQGQDELLAATMVRVNTLAAQVVVSARRGPRPVSVSAEEAVMKTVPLDGPAGRLSRQAVA